MERRRILLGAASLAATSVILRTSSIARSAEVDDVRFGTTSRFAPLVTDATMFMQELEREKPSRISQARVTGITVPHHLLAGDLIARGVWAAAGNSYDRIILMSPDHFKQSHRLIATTRRGFDTALGPVDVDQPAIEVLLKNSGIAE